MNDFCVVSKHPDLIKFVDALQKKNAEALSFYPRQVFEREQAKGRILLGILNGMPCGYIYMGSCASDVRVHQVCIQYDVRRRLYGAALVAAMENCAKNAFSITLRCGFDLEANKFWGELGYKCIGIVDGGARRMRKINVWRKNVVNELFPIPEIVPAEGKTDASLWRKHKVVGLVSSFARGASLAHYRSLIERP